MRSRRIFSLFFLPYLGLRRK
ncbi:MAG: GlyGly-CTERM sorting domain-containing protein [Methanobacteriota archaeon]|nr:MAG: GlyGly-CTERM sorting domain-containing protein [Euryarchaeota archaeon]